MITIENNRIKVSVKSKGAELDSIYNKETKMEYMWSGDPAFWGKKSPVLFPVVGTLKNDTYYFDHKEYSLTRHGFAREMEFMVTGQTSESVQFTLKSNEITFSKYPFSFRFDVIYRVQADQLIVTYNVFNAGNDTLYFSVGGHPAFRVPLKEGTEYSDYYLEFSEQEHTGRWPISKDGLIESSPVPLLNNTSRLELTKELFYADALVFKDLHSTSVNLRCHKDEHGLTFDFTGFPYLGIWAAKNADFVCIEPWCGIADSVSSDQQLKNKEGIIALETGDTFARSWSVKLF